MAIDKDPGNPEESISSATKGLADALTNLNKILGQQVSGIVPEIQDSLASSLRKASNSLSEAAAKTASPRNRQSKKVDQTRAELLEAAAQVFSDKGYEGASMGDIGAAAGYTKGALYAHFKSKEDLFHKVVEASTTEAAATPTIIPGAEKGAIRKKALASWLEHAAADRHLLLSLEFLAYGIRHPDAHYDFARLSQCSLEDLAIDVCRIRHLRTGNEMPSTLVPDRGDLDTVLTIAAIANYVTLQSRLSADSYASPESGARVIAKALEDNDR